ncbi:phosphatase PAP2 family protein [Leifsonia sp. F6_8S_P_1B]|uniref:Phosphatase PAP2 family protein n=1 Tax=Leifsonia williamsii TaxID=3035919 RepID=A0ABT8KCZ0_9MICO|nr:phosphatase PAP2 family protein [Leifsonia williamsii]MDN4615324.1 phosphatase PAP2 family protein [Leifsonia williamsii]
MPAAADLRTSRLSDWNKRFVVEERYVPAATRRRLYATSVALVAVGLIAFVVLAANVMTHTGYERLDVPVERWFNAQRSAETTGFMTVLAIIFGPVAMPFIVLITVIVWALTARHLWRPFLLAAGMLTGVLLAQLLAPLIRHPRPPVSLMLMGPDHTFSFPSGHVLGASDFFLIFAFLLASRIQRRWFTVAAFVVAAALVVLQVASRLYLGYHWISDTTGSVALSLAVVGGVIALDTRRTVRVEGERIEGGLSQPQVDGT